MAQLQIRPSAQRSEPLPLLRPGLAQPCRDQTCVKPVSPVLSDSLSLSTRRGTVPVPASPEPAFPDNTAAKARIEVFFTRPGNPPAPDQLPPDPVNGPEPVDPLAPNHWRSPDQALAELIGSARQSVEIAAFELDNALIRDAILKAHGAGRLVRVVTDNEHRQEKAILALEAAGIEVVDDQRAGLMHNKFVVIDQGTPEAAVWTGSMNLTDNCVNKNNNNALLIRSPELAENYHAEFEEMFVDKSFGRTSPAFVPHPQVSVGKSLIETHFAAEGHVAGRVVEALNQAKQSIHFMAFSFTHDAIGQVVAAKLADKVSVHGVFEKTGSGSQYSEYTRLKALGADVRTDSNPGIMHHKVFIIDGKTVITGSFNFSESADESNDENLLIIEDPELAKLYLEEFERVNREEVGRRS
ncbi:MAG: phospholipase D-like domain-containing protein [Candidatus Sericytochromatia bacterium]